MTWMIRAEEAPTDIAAIHAATAGASKDAAHSSHTSTTSSMHCASAANG